MKKIIGVSLVFLVLTACQYNTRDYNRFPVGTEIHLNHPIEFGATQVAIYFQFGRIVAANSVDDYKANCSLELKHKLKHQQSFQPDSFLIDTVRYSVSQVGFPNYTHSLSLGGASRFPEYTTEITLHSRRQPNIFRLTCQHLEDPTNARHLSLIEIQNALGNIMSIIHPE